MEDKIKIVGEKEILHILNNPPNVYHESKGIVQPIATPAWQVIHSKALAKVLAEEIIVLNKEGK